MLKRLSALGASATVAFAMIAQIQIAGASETQRPKPGPGYVWKCIKTLHVCDWVLARYVNKPGKDSPDRTKPTKRPVQATKPTCQLTGGAPQACKSILGNWSNSRQCYLQKLSEPPRVR